jgi:hypothetical protein
MATNNNGYIKMKDIVISTNLGVKKSNKDMKTINTDKVKYFVSTEDPLVHLETLHSTHPQSIWRDAHNAYHKSIKDLDSIDDGSHVINDNICQFDALQYNIVNNNIIISNIQNIAHTISSTTNSTTTSASILNDNHVVSNHMKIKELIHTYYNINKFCVTSLLSLLLVKSDSVMNNLNIIDIRYNLEKNVLNDYNKGIVQTGIRQISTPYHDAGLTGTDEIIGVGDTGTVY